MTGEARLRVTLLGTFQVSRGDTVLPVPGTRLRGLVVRLALAGGRAVEPGVLVDAIWAEVPPSGPAAALQTLVSRLRRTLGSTGAVAQVPGGYRLDVDPADVDVFRFEQLVTTGRERLHAGDPDAAAVALAEAVQVWGDPPGTEPSVVAAVAPAAATRLARTSVEAVADLADAELSLGRADTAATRLTALLTEHPVEERAAALLIDALTAQGRQADALARYELTRQALAEVLGADPGAALRERHLRLLRADHAVPAVDAAQVRSTLPAPVTSFIGRDDDLARIAELLTAGRLITVLGPGGSGKTRLAVEAALGLRDAYGDRVWMIDLAPVTEPAKVGAAVLAGIGLRGAMFEARARAEGTELDVLADHLGGRESLLLVDNCEHLIDAVAHLIAALLSRCGHLRVLATSREPLAVDGEALVPLGPLTLPGADDGVEQARRTSSVRLFTERAAAVRPGFAVEAGNLGDVLRIVRDLDGLPLALELAAARLRTLTLPDLASGLSDRFRLLTTGSRTALPRHRTLRSVIAWSWDLLDAGARTVAERISVLPGGVTPVSAGALCAGTRVPPGDIPDLLASLVDRSLLQLGPDTGRYRMLETIREYGLERLTEQGARDGVRDLAARFFAGQIAGYDPQLRGPGQLVALRAISDDYDNVLAALRRCCDTGDAPIALALNLTWYWQLAGRHHDAAFWLGEVLAVPGHGPAPDRDCAEAIYLFNRATTTRNATDDGPRLRELAGRLVACPELPSPYAALAALPIAFVQEEAALQILERVAAGGDVWLSGLVHLFRAEFADNAGELDTMRAGVEAALTCFAQAGDRWGQAAALPMRARLRQYDGDLDGARADLSAARSLSAEFGAGDEVWGDLRWIDLHLRCGETGPALAMFEAARERASRGAAPDTLVLVDAREAELRIRLGDLDRARELLAGATVSGANVSGDHLRVQVAAVRASLQLALGDPAGAETALTEAYASALRTRDRPILSLVAVHTAALAQAQGRHGESAVLLGAASRLRGAHDRTDPLVRELTGAGQAALGEDAFAAAYGRGWDLDVAKAVAEVDPAHLRLQ